MKSVKNLRTFRLGLSLLVVWLATPWAHGAIPGTTFKALAAFGDTNNGANPYAPPVLGADGNLYGTAPYGGTNAVGVIYKASTNAPSITLHRFNTRDGAYPYAKLAAGNDDQLYGVASAGGTNNDGTIFTITTNGTFSLLYSFGMVTNNLGYALDGSAPYGGMIQGRDGNFYGTTYTGGTNNVGTVFQFMTNGTLISLHSFMGNGSNDEGANPYTAPLVEGEDGVFYGTTYGGGTNNDGTVFRIAADGTFSTVFEFDQTNGMTPFAGVCYGMNGMLYGTAAQGGTTNLGTVFQLTTNGLLTTLFQFRNPYGFYPDGGVILGSNNILYGTTYRGGGANGYGTVFQLTTNSLLTTLYIFTNGSDGANPYAGVTLDAHGNLYGTALYGGTNGGYGTVYRWSDPTPPTNSIIVPATGQRWSNALFTASGKAGDNVGAADVFYSVNGSDWSQAVTINQWTNWTAPVTLRPGTNLLQSYAEDYSGNLSATNSVSFDFVVTNQLTLTTMGMGTFNPNDSNAWLEIGRNYNIAVTPANGFVFTNWLVSTNGIDGGALVTGATLYFMMSSNLSLQANFLDVTRPTNSITAPTTGQKMTNALATILGTAADNWRVADVLYQLNGGNWSEATTTNNYTNWTSSLLTLVSGTNSVKAYAVDSSGNFSITNSVNFYSSNTFELQMSFAAAEPLTPAGLNFNLQISPGLNGQIEVSTNLITWSAFTNFVGSSTNVSYRDTSATNVSRRFYRAVIP